MHAAYAAKFWWWRSDGVLEVAPGLRLASEGLPRYRLVWLTFPRAAGRVYQSSSETVDFRFDDPAELRRGHDIREMKTAHGATWRHVDGSVAVRIPRSVPTVGSSETGLILVWVEMNGHHYAGVGAGCANGLDHFS